MLPPSPCASRCLATARERRKVPSRFVTRTFFQVSYESSVTGTRSSPRAAPALFTTMSSRPNSARVRFTRSSFACSLLTSETSASTRPPTARTSSATLAMSRQPAAFSSSG